MLQTVKISDWYHKNWGLIDPERLKHFLVFISFLEPFFVLFGKLQLVRECFLDAFDILRPFSVCFGPFKINSVCFSCFEIHPKQNFYWFRQWTETNAKQILFRLFSVRTKTNFHSFCWHPTLKHWALAYNITSIFLFFCSNKAIIIKHVPDFIAGFSTPQLLKPELLINREQILNFLMILNVGIDSENRVGKRVAQCPCSIKC